MSVETDTETRVHGGRLIARRLKAHGVTKLFTLSGGHIFSIYDGCRAEGIDIVDTRHEQAATFAAERPVIMAGTNLYWGRGEHALRELAEARGIPVYLNGQARGCLPADHELFFSRARGEGLKGADLALVIGVPMDFRLAFGASFGEETEIVVIDRAEPVRDHPRAVAAELYGGLEATLRALTGDGTDTSAWVAHL